MAFSAARVCVRGDVRAAAAGGERLEDPVVGGLGDAHRGGGVEGARVQVAVHPVAGQAAGREPAAERPSGSRTSSKDTDWLPEARMPMASQSSCILTPGASAGIWA